MQSDKGGAALSSFDRREFLVSSAAGSLALAAGASGLTARGATSANEKVTIGVMGGGQIASAGKIIETRLNALQFPAAAANAVILLGVTIMIIAALTRVVDIRKEL